MERESQFPRSRRLRSDRPDAEFDPAELSAKANAIRRRALAMIYRAGSGHPGGSLSAADILAYLYWRELRFRVDDPAWEDRDRFVLSKGHACPALYAVAAQVGLLSYSALSGFRRLGSPLQGHPHLGSTPWVEASTGSLGQGFSAAIGMALGLRFLGRKARVYVMVGDGELQEGEIWEGAMLAGHRKLDNLCLIIDYNKMQSDDLNESVVGLEPLRRKWEAFNWSAQEIDGHDFRAIAKGLEWARQNAGAPSVIIAHTLKGKGVSFMEGSPAWHGSVKLRREEVVQALGELGASGPEIEELIDEK